MYNICHFVHFFFFCFHNSINIICSTISINIICSTISINIICSAISNSINCSTTSNNICRTISIASRFPAISLPAPRSRWSQYGEMIYPLDGGDKPHMTPLVKGGVLGSGSTLLISTSSFFKLLVELPSFYLYRKLTF
ncbi:uncharacterized protein LOC124809843 [Hydra vulgaris]|uniref:uncharacterized protein LOC124809843 n=1 Tax=Hydra vulgaris TaxID=6087 RepID=UPI0032EA64D3